MQELSHGMYVFYSEMVDIEGGINQHFQLLPVCPHDQFT